ncbi:MAG: transporter substrate-binding domain-containing protein [Caldicoprobacter oshimai]
MKRSTIVLLTLALMVGLLLSACSGAQETAKDDSLERIKQAGKFIVGLDDTFAPMGFRDEEGNIVRFDIDLAKEAAKRLGVEVEFKPIDWNSKELELKFLKADALEARVLTGKDNRYEAAKIIHEWGVKEIMITHKIVK